MAKGRRPHNDPPVQIHISLPTTLVARVELLLFDPSRGKMRYGGLSGLLKALLTQWLESTGPLTEELTGQLNKEAPCPQPPHNQ